ncbi:unnamed protein product [Blepharisma stoltei]|uniref:Uncharacterized protein n=1 Tax=Blepharisma stoltei TaxID=1481888 RepID=A0AAU9IDN1_9CILI|nr:unnamed protein product [Blepharisma stoltei]
MRIFGVLLNVIILANCQLLVDIIYSSFTNQEFMSNLTYFLQKNIQSHEFSLINADALRDINLAADIPDLIFDISFSTSFLDSIQIFAKENHAIIASLDRKVEQYSDLQVLFTIHWRINLKLCLVLFLI